MDDITDNGITDEVVLDVEGVPLWIALAWAAAAHGVAGAYWPAAFGAAAVRTPMTTDSAGRWLREVIRRTERNMSDLALLERQVGWGPNPAPRSPDWWEGEDGGLCLSWDTSVSLRLCTAEEDLGLLRLVLHGRHEERLALAREALARSPGASEDRAIEAWASIVGEYTQAMAMGLADDERALLARVDAERLAALAAYGRLVGRA